MWRGPHGNGQSDETNVPTRWSATDNVAWKVPIPGKGHSSPVVCGDRIFLTTALEQENQRVLLCLSRTDGKTLWQRTVLKAPLEHKNGLNSYASGTPAADGRHVFVAFFGQPNIDLVCYDFDGNEVWRKVPGTFSSVHGFCSSPVLYKDTVILNCDQDAPPDAQAFIVALDRETGAEKWRIDRPNRTRSYVTPLIADLAGKTQMVLSGSKCVASYDPDTGKQNWVMDGPTEQMVASLVTTDGVAVRHRRLPRAPPARHRPLRRRRRHPHPRPLARPPARLLRPLADRPRPLVLRRQPTTASAAASRPRPAKLLWKHRLGQHHSASAVSAGDNLYFTSDAGETFVLKGTDQLRTGGEERSGRRRPRLAGHQPGADLHPHDAEPLLHREMK